MNDIRNEMPLAIDFVKCAEKKPFRIRPEGNKRMVVTSWRPIEEYDPSKHDVPERTSRT